MKLWVLLMLCAVAAAAPSTNENNASAVPSLSFETDRSERNFLVNALVQRLIRYLRHVINNGSLIFGVGPLDPFVLDSYSLALKAGLINMDIDLSGIGATGLGQFEVHRSQLSLRDLTFDLDISIPELDITAENYNLVGDLYSAIPLYGNGKARFIVEGFRFGGKLYLKQSDDGSSVLIDKIESPFFYIPGLRSKLSGVIGGGDIDAVVNALAEDVIISYVNQFQTFISRTFSDFLIAFGNPVLNTLDTWKYIAPLVPRPRP